MLRDYYFDNAKAILIILVVIGHVIEPWAKVNHPLLLPAYVFIYSFHMPLFILLAGYFAQYIKDFNAKMMKYFGLFIVFTLVYWLFSDYPLWVELISPHNLLWFLFSLITWYCLLPFITKFKYPILLSLVIAITAGYFDVIGRAASLSRTLTFLPFFMFGYYIDKEWFRRIQSIPKLPVILFLSMFLIFLLLYGSQINYHWIYGLSSYSSIGYPHWYAGIYRLCHLLLAAIIGICILSFTPPKHIAFTWIGSKTLYIYLIHGVILKTLFLFIAS